MLGPIEVLFLEDHSNIHGERSPIGEAVYWAKSYDDKPGSRRDADAVARAARIWLGKEFDSTRVAKPAGVVAIPPKPERLGLSLPVVLAEAIGRELDVPVIAPFQWLPGTAQAKHLPPEDRQRSLERMLDVTGPVPSGTILVVDDVIHTGATISVVARALKRLGASKVIAFAPSRARGSRGTSRR